MDFNPSVNEVWCDGTEAFEKYTGYTSVFNMGLAFSYYKQRKVMLLLNSFICNKQTFVTSPNGNEWRAYIRYMYGLAWISFFSFATKSKNTWSIR